LKYFLLQPQLIKKYIVHNILTIYSKKMTKENTSLENTIETEPVKYSRLKKVGSRIGDVVGGIIAAAIFAGIVGYAGLTCYQTFPGEEENTTVTRRESRAVLDQSGIIMGYRQLIRIDNDIRCLEIENFYNGPIDKSDVLEYISWDFNIRPWLCNVVDEYRVAKQDQVGQIQK